MTAIRVTPIRSAQIDPKRTPAINSLRTRNGPRPGRPWNSPSCGGSQRRNQGFVKAKKMLDTLAVTGESSRSIKTVDHPIEGIMRAA
jgi:hypothetical protein